MNKIDNYEISVFGFMLNPAMKEKLKKLKTLKNSLIFTGFIKILIKIKTINCRKKQRFLINKKLLFCSWDWICRRYKRR